MKKENYRNRSKWDFLVYVHDYIVLAGLFPFFAMICEADDGTFRQICACSLLLFLPILTSYLFLQRTKYLGLYVLEGIGVSAVSLCLAICLSGDAQGKWLVPALVGFACFALFMSGIGAKNAYGDAKKEYQATHPGQGMEAFYLTEWDVETLFNNPRIFHLCFMGFFYLAGVLLHFERYLKIQFVLIVADILLISVYRFLLGMREYLHENRTLHHIPAAAMAKTHAVSGIIAGVILVMCMLPAIFYGKEFYPNFSAPDNPIEITQSQSTYTAPVEAEPEAMPEWMEGLEENKEPPAWLNPLFYFLGYTILALLILALIAGIIRKIRETGRNFAEEDEDTVELLEEVKEEKTHINSALRFANRHFSKRQKIRKQYKKAIKKATAGTPVPWGSPTELEKDAGRTDEEMQALHEAYEQARYDREGTEEE